MISILKLILEKKQKYDYGCVMLYFTFPQLNKIQDAINPDDLYTGDGTDDRSYGLEDESHTTLLFGLHEEVTLKQVKSVLDKYTYGECKLYNVSTFDNPKYDVLKFDVKGPNLIETNKDLCQFPYTSDYPDFHPHSTIAYLKPGTGKKYTKMFKGQEFTLTPKYAVYSVPDGTKHKIKIKIS